MSGLAGVEVGTNKFTDLDYADDIVLHVRDYDELIPCCQRPKFNASENLVRCQTRFSFDNNNTICLFLT